MLWYAPDSAYGRPDDLKALIDEAHLRGLMVFLDVVYNHFGPEGNYLGRYAPGFFTEAQTPWGSAIDYRVPQVRAFAIENALYWLREYRFDGLRLDAVNSIVEPGGLSMLHDLSAAAGELAAETGRHIHLVLENGDNRASMLDATQDPPRGKYRAQWNDDYHHAWHVLMTGENAGLLRRLSAFAARRHRPIAVVRLCLSGRNVGVSRRQGAASRAASLRPPPSSISCRTTTRSATARSATGSKAWPNRKRSRPRSPSCCWRPPFRCCSWARNGARRRRFRSSAISRAIWRTPSARAAAANTPGPMPKYGDEIPDPLEPSTFQSAVLDWNERDEPVAQRRLTRLQELLAIRRREIVPRLAGATFGDAKAADDGLLTAHWRMGDGATLRLLANLSDREAANTSDVFKGTLIWGSELGERVPPWSVFWRIG